MKTLACAAAVAVMIPAAAMAADPALTVTDAYAISANAMAGAAFMMIENHGAQDCTLKAATSDAAELVELHTHKEEGGVMKMVKVEEGFPIPAGGSHALDRGGDHVMFMGLKAPFPQGGTVKLSLDFGDCGTLDLDVPVDNARKPGMGMGMGMGGSMGMHRHMMPGMAGMSGMSGMSGMAAPSN